MNSVGKILVVFITASSLGFLAFVAAMRNGGPDWQGEMRSEDLQREFVFSSESGERTTYSAKHRATDSSVADKTPVRAEVVLKARKRLEDEANKKFQELSPRVQPLTDLIALTKKLIPIDDAGVKVRFEKIEQRMAQLVAQLQEIGTQFSVATLQTQERMRVAQERREEGYRLTNQLELLRNDSYSAAVQQRVLEDELVRLEENKRRLELRQNELKQQLGDSYSSSK